MTNLKLLILLPLSIFSQNLFAQVEDLLKNKDITWAAEIMTDFIVDDEERDEKPLPPVIIHTLKVMPPRELQDENLNELFENIVSNAIFRKNKQVFKDSLLQKPISLNTLRGLDTFRTVDSLTGEVRFKVVVCAYRTHEKYQYFRARQILYYNASKTQFELLTIAFAPMICRRNESGEILDTVPYVWIPAKSILKSPKLSSSNIIWAKRLYKRGGMALEKMKILKKTDDDMPISHFLSAFAYNPKVPFYATESFLIGFDNPRRLNMKERNRIFERRDTVPYCFPPADYKGDGAIVLYHRLKENDLPNLRIVQEWYWDNHKNELLIHLHSVAPMKNCTNEAGEFLYREAIFYRKNDD